MQLGKTIKMESDVFTGGVSADTVDLSHFYPTVSKISASAILNTVTKHALSDRGTFKGKFMNLDGFSDAKEPIEVRVYFPTESDQKVVQTTFTYTRCINRFVSDWAKHQVENNKTDIPPLGLVIGWGALTEQKTYELIAEKTEGTVKELAEEMKNDSKLRRIAFMPAVAKFRPDPSMKLNQLEMHLCMCFAFLTDAVANYKCDGKIHETVKTTHFSSDMYSSLKKCGYTFKMDEFRTVSRIVFVKCAFKINLKTELTKEMVKELISLAVNISSMIGRGDELKSKKDVDDDHITTYIKNSKIKKESK